MYQFIVASQNTSSVPCGIVNVSFRNN